MKIKEMNLTEIREICKKHYHAKACDQNCPLYRYRIDKKERKIELFCHGYAYSWYIETKNTILKREDITEDERQLLLDVLERDYNETLEKEI